jgi:hypothetical protein
VLPEVLGPALYDDLPPPLLQLQRALLALLLLYLRLQGIINARIINYSAFVKFCFNLIYCLYVFSISVCRA